MISRTDESMEGVVFDVQDHTRRTGTRGPVHMGRWLAQTSMGMKSPLDGCWDGRGRTTSWWALAWRRQKDALTRTLWQRLTKGGSPPADGMMALMDRKPPRTGWTFSGADGSVLGLFGTCGRLQEPQRGQRFAFWMMIMPWKGQRLPQRGLTSPFLAHSLTF